MESPWVLWLVSQIEKHIFRYWIFPRWRKMEVALTWHDHLFRQQAPGASRCYFAVAPIRGSYQTGAKWLSGASPAFSIQISVTLPWWSPTSMLVIACQAFWLRPVPQGHSFALQKSQSGQNEGKSRIQRKRVDVGSAGWRHCVGRDWVARDSVPPGSGVSSPGEVAATL